MEFEWDENKNKLNVQKHGLNFNDAKEVFNDLNSILTPDLRKDYNEERWKMIGKIYGIVISVIFTKRNHVIRIISARKASSRERTEYNQNK
ncbi:MAG: BrnT family toxin [Bacteroidetes bacterium]|nr:MAG: BrnT family toxin [Bacteroidota bacterium]